MQAGQGRTSIGFATMGAVPNATARHGQSGHSTAKWGLTWTSIHARSGLRVQAPGRWKKKQSTAYQESSEVLSPGKHSLVLEDARVIRGNSGLHLRGSVLVFSISSTSFSPGMHGPMAMWLLIDNR